jgi:hypothetical protein
VAYDGQPKVKVGREFLLKKRNGGIMPSDDSDTGSGDD